MTALLIVIAVFAAFGIGATVNAVRADGYGPRSSTTR